MKSHFIWTSKRMYIFGFILFKVTRKKSGKWKKWTAAALAVSVIGGGVAAAKLPYFVGEQVVSVIDGDSFKIANDQTIRLASLNAPDIKFCYGQEAYRALRTKILGKKVILRGLKTDLYRRIMALVYVDGELVNEYMIKNGFAASTRQAGDENPKITKANFFAREHHLGIFSPECTQIDPPDPKCLIKGNINDRNGQKQYLTPDCPDWSKTIIEKWTGEQWFCNEKSAKSAGFSKSPSCSR